MPVIDQEAHWSERYRQAGEEYLFGVAPSRFLEAHRELLSVGTTALSIADGEGRNSVWLAEQGLSVKAIEISAVALEKARKLARGRGVGVDFVKADVLTDDWGPNRYDLVVAVFVQFATPSEQPLLFARMKQATAPGGLVLLHGYTPKQLEYRTGGPSTVENLYTKAMLEEAFADFEILELREYEQTLTEGHGHKGVSAVIDLVARRPAQTS
jgi:cyclopropane fatty-acyl-phospholipid synthase-like methyltransferase